MAPLAPNTLIHRYADIPCPSRKHPRSLVTCRNHSVAAMFCIPCEREWTVSTLHPQLAAMDRDETDHA